MKENALRSPLHGMSASVLAKNIFMLGHTLLSKSFLHIIAIIPPLCRELVDEYRIPFPVTIGRHQVERFAARRRAVD